LIHDRFSIYELNTVCDRSDLREFGYLYFIHPTVSKEYAFQILKPIEGKTHPKHAGKNQEFKQSFLLERLEQLEVI